MRRPGARLRSWAARLLDPSTMERVIDPAITDLQHEYREAVRRGLVWRGRGIRLAGYAAFWKVAVMAAARHAVHERTAADDCAVGRTVVFSLAAVIALTAVLMLPQLRAVRLLGTGTTSWLMLYLVPSALVVALPLGLVFGILLGLRDRLSTARVKWTVVVLGIGCSAAAFIIVAWLMPAANQAFRELAAGRRVLRGFNELTLGELASGDPIRLMRARRLVWEFNYRVALAFAPLVLGLFSLGVTAARRRDYGPATMGAAALTASFGYYALLFYSRQGFLHGDWLPPAVAAWSPNLVFVAITLILFHRLRTAPKERYQ
jgi:hypothetical protein